MVKTRADSPSAGLRTLEDVPIRTRTHIRTRPELARATGALGVAGLLALTVLLGCGANSFSAAKRADEPEAYYAFINSRPDSPRVAEARERIAYHEVLQSPSVVAYENFVDRYPNSELVVSLRPLVEAEAFEIARAAGSAEAYEAFAERFADGDFAQRALGNAEYQRADGYVGQLEALERFASRYPESDFAAEAMRTVESVRVKESKHYQRVILTVDLEESQPQREQLIDEFTRRATAQYEEYGVELVVAESFGSTAPLVVDDPAGDSLWLTIHHREGLEDARIEEDSTVRPRTLRVETRVTLATAVQATSDSGDPLAPGDSLDPIWERRFVIARPANEISPDASALLAASAAEYWSQWFVPVASWELASATRSAMSLPGTAVALDAARDRVAVLFADGGVQVIELADPTQPLVLGEYQPAARSGGGGTDSGFGGLRIYRDRILLFGRNGLASLQFGSSGPLLTVERTHDQIGTIAAVEPVGDDLLMASDRGLLLWRDRGKQPLQVLARPVHGLAMVGETLLFTDRTSLYISTLEHLRKQRVLARLPLGDDFSGGRHGRTGTVRSFGSTVAILGQSGTLLIDLREPRKPRILGQLELERAGVVRDVARVGGRVFVLGERGLQQLSRDASVVAESIEVVPTTRVDRMGRYLVTVGDGWLQAVDASPFIAAQDAPAASWDAAPEGGAEPGDGNW